MKKSPKILVVGLMVILSFIQSEAQVSGFGIGFATEADPNISSGVHYLDNVRAEVIAVTSSTSNTFCVNISNTTGSFAIDDMALLIQMNGGTIGTHQNVWIKSNNCASGALKLEAVFGSMLSYTVGGGANLQLIIIHRYSNFTLSGGIVTCKPYDGHTGGILPIIVNGTMSISGGLISLDGKGYTSIDAGHTFASGGAGASAASAPTPLSSTAAPGFWWFDSGGGCGSIAIPASLIGAKGGKANNSGSSGSANGAGTPISKSTYYTLLKMGNPGSTTAGYGSGNGAGGGGFGGAGSDNSACSTTGSAGLSGNAGGPGGAAGKGGRGGGALIIKALDVNVTNNGVVISANGGNALNGGNGANGGTGGLGGPGGLGCCASAGMDGGAGGYGDVGEGGTGGDGGNGGDAGFVWIACKNNYTWTATNNANNYSVLGGSGANGGKGGWGGGNKTFSTIPGDNRCTGSPCTSGASTCKYECNTDYTMCYIAANAKCASAAGSDTKFYSDINCSASSLIGHYKSSISTLEVYNGCDIYISEWSGSTKSPTDMFKHFRTTSGVSTKVGGIVTYDNPFNPVASGCGISGSSVHIDFFNSSGELILTYDHETPDGPAWIDELETSNRITTTECNDIGASSSKAADGQSGSNGQNGTYTTQNPGNDNIIIDIQPPFILLPLNGSDIKNQLKAKVYPNPVSKDLFIEMAASANEKLMISITDITGRKVLMQNEWIGEGTNKLYVNIKDLNAGIYLIELKTSKKTSLLNLKIY